MNSTHLKPQADVLACVEYTLRRSLKCFGDNVSPCCVKIYK